VPMHFQKLQVFAKELSPSAKASPIDDSFLSFFYSYSIHLYREFYGAKQQPGTYNAPNQSF
jgi:hypothetical protein